MLSRREFLKAAGAAAGLALSLNYLELSREVRAEQSASGGRIIDGYDYASWEDLYREKWRWDKVVRGTHLRTDCIAACAWDLYVKDGIVWREEQAVRYAQTNPQIPEFGPRGCQKGACYSDLMYSPSRIKYPLKRLGSRGSAKWKRISWDEALDEIAHKLVEVAAKEGPECIWYDHGTTNVDFGPSTAGEQRLFSLLGVTFLDSWAGVGDLPMGAIQTWGMFNVDGTSDDWFRSDYIVVWLGNPVYTRIPEMHYMLEARYRGAKLVVVAPDYNATAIHADLWLNPRVGSDAALALGAAQVIIAEGLYDRDYVCEQTDLPLLVREDTNKFLRESDVEKGGAENVFYLWDSSKNKLERAPGSEGLKRGNLKLYTRKPALEGRFTVELADGRKVGVRPVFEVLREHLNANFTPEAASRQTGIDPKLIRRLGREFAEARSAMIFASWGSCKHYHSDLMQRAMILLVALTGNQGKPGGGLRIGAWWSLEGFERMANAYDLSLMDRFLIGMAKPSVRDFEEFFTRLVRERYAYTSVLYSLYHHGGFDKVVSRGEFNDPGLKRPFSEYVKEADEKGWMPFYPRKGKSPKIYIFSGLNPLRRWPTPQVAREVLWPKLDLAVSINFRMSTTGLYSDIILPAAGYYEKIGIKFTQTYLPYVVIGDRAVAPLFESKGEWEVSGLLARKIAEQAEKAAIREVTDVFGNRHDLTAIYDAWSKGGEWEPGDDAKAMEYILEESPVTAGTSWSEARKLGIVKIKSTGRYSGIDAVCSDLTEGEPVSPSQWFVKDKQPWPTLTGRQQFFIDHDWYLELGEALPTHKPPPQAGGDYLLRLTGGHTRWSIHAIWRDQRFMLQLQRGEPVVYIGSSDAKARGISDHDRVRVYNDVGSFSARAKISPTLQPGQVVVYHAWEPYQFPKWQGNQEVVASPWKPLHLVGDYGQLHYRTFLAQPSHTPRATAVEVERIRI